MFRRRITSNPTGDSTGDSTGGSTGGSTADPTAERSEETIRRLQARAEAERKSTPTPTRRQAEAARRERLKPTTDRKQRAKRDRQRRAEERRKVRASLAAGDDKHLPPRDQGPVRRFARDFVDSRRNVAQYLLPLLFVVLLLSLYPPLAQAYFLLWSLTIALTTVDSIWMSVRFRRELRARFEPARAKGATSYALLRSTQLRRLRLPKPQVAYGDKLPQRY